MAMIPQGDPSEAVVGLSIQPLEAVFNQISTLQLAAGPATTAPLARTPNPQIMTDPAQLAQKVVQNLFNFLSSFESVGDGVFVRLADLERWYDKFIQKIKNQGLQFLDGV